MRKQQVLDLVLGGNQRVEFSRLFVLDGFQQERHLPLAQQRLKVNPRMVSNEDIPNKCESRTSSNVSAGLSKVQLVKTATSPTRVGITIPPSYSNAEDNRHKIARFGKDDKDNDKGSKSRSQSMKEQDYNEDKDQEHSSLNDKSNLTDLMKECHQ
ncbi:hypothetical protein Tco_0646374 [Tanacetum coccineum]